MLCKPSPATKRDRPLLVHAGRFVVWILVFMAIVFAVLQVLSWLQ